MISLYSGTPGSGKSLHAANTIYWQLRSKRPVIANFDIACRFISKAHPDDVPFFELDDDEITPEWLIEFSRVYFLSIGKSVREDQILLVIDECQLMFNAREWQRDGRASWLSFFTKHRKYGYRIILIAQFDRMVDRQIRSLIEYEYIHRKVSNFGVGGFFLSLLSFGRLFVSVKVWYPLREKVGSEFFHARKKYYQLYDTFDTFGARAVVDTAPAAVDLPGFGDPAKDTAPGAQIEQNQNPNLKTAAGDDTLQTA